MPWIIVLSEREAAEWVFAQERMAFRKNASPERLQRGDQIAIYITRGAHHCPHRDEAQIVAVGAVTGQVERQTTKIAGQRFDLVCDLRFDRVLPLRHGVSFRPLVKRLGFIRNKTSWPSHMRRTLVEIPERDFLTIQEAVIEHDPEWAARSALRQARAAHVQTA